MMKFMMMMFLIPAMKNYTSMMITIIFLFNTSLTQEMSKISSLMMVDHLSFWMISLSMWITVTIMDMKHKNEKMYKMNVLIICLILVISFSSWNFVMFYIAFELSMITMLTLIMVWGYQPDRMQASMLMFIITLMFSLPFFIAIILKSNHMDFMEFSPKMSPVNFIMMIIMMSVKVPIFMLHMWLPKAHVESPTSGSILLAAIMLKLGMYGIIRMGENMILFKQMTELMIPIMIWGALILSMINMMQTDIKMIVAYSSVVHMMISLPNIMIYKQKSMIATMMTMMGHGLCSATLFMMIGVMYKNSKSRNLIMNKMNTNFMPPTTMVWFFICMNNTPLPPSMNMMAEMMTMTSIIFWSKALTEIMLTIMFMSSMYSIYLFYITSHNSSSKMMKNTKMENMMEIIMMTVLTLPTLIITFKPTMMMI